MYKVTADELTNAVKIHENSKITKGSLPIKERTATEVMPKMSFPWLFQELLGKIAKSHNAEAGQPESNIEQHKTAVMKAPQLASPVPVGSVSLIDEGPSIVDQVEGPQVLDDDEIAEGGVAEDEVIELKPRTTMQDRLAKFINRTA